MSRTAFPRLILNLVAAALLTGTVAGQAQADTVWRFPPKGGAPYAVPHEHNDRVTKAWKTTKQISKQGYAQSRHSNPSLAGRAGLTPRMRAITGLTSRPSLKVSQAVPTDTSAIVLAHHKSGYHDGVPRSGKPVVSQPQRRSIV
jgi:hypothetical protein